jgi:primase-polymerase (primpol)-like protein
MGLCFYLAFWTGGDPERMDQLFRESGLMREKWDRRHYGNGAKYGEVCVARSLLQVDDYYDPPPESNTGPDIPTPENRPPPSVPQPEENDESAIAHAQRLATKVQQQERELAAQRERIHELEAQRQWYRRLIASLGIDPPEEEVATPEGTDVSRDKNPAPDDTPEDGSGMALGMAGWLRRWIP